MKVQEALAILKPEQNNEAGLKAAYRSACMKYHPDRGGDLSMMQLVNLAYETLQAMDTWWSASAARQAAKETPLTEVIQAVWDKIKHLPNIKAELIGSWLWITGNTFPVREALKDAGLKYSKKKVAWYFHAEDYRRFSKTEYSLDAIRYRYGSSEINKSEPIEVIAQF